MNNLPFELPGRFWRGNLHTHSNRSDGALPPDRLARRYQEAGFDFLAVTDHFRAEYGFPVADTRALRSAEFTTIIGAELHAPRTEHSAEWHFVAVGLPLDFAPPRPGETGPELARRARVAGAFIGMAHPAASLRTLADAGTLDAADAVEVYNALAGGPRRQLAPVRAPARPGVTGWACTRPTTPISSRTTRPPAPPGFRCGPSHSTRRRWSPRSKRATTTPAPAPRSTASMCAMAASPSYARRQARCWSPGACRARSSGSATG